MRGDTEGQESVPNRSEFSEELEQVFWRDVVAVESLLEPMLTKGRAAGFPRHTLDSLRIKLCYQLILACCDTPRRNERCMGAACRLPQARHAGRGSTGAGTTRGVVRSERNKRDSARSGDCLDLPIDLRGKLAGATHISMKFRRFRSPGSVLFGCWPFDGIVFGGGEVGCRAWPALG